MREKRPPYPRPFIDNRGKKRWRLRGIYKGERYDLYFPGQPGEDRFDEFYADFLSEALSKKCKSAVPIPKKGTFAAACVAYYESLEFSSLKDSSKRAVRTAIEPLRAKYGHLPIKDLERHHIKGLMAKQSGPGAANKLLRYFRQVLNAAVDRKWIKTNPAAGIKAQKVPGDGFKSWDEEHIARYEKHWPIGTKQRLAFDLLLYTGQRRSDIVTMTPSNVKDGEIRVVQQKTGTALWIPLHPALLRSIDATPRDGLQFITTSHKRPYTAQGFGNWFRDQCDAAGILKGYSAHGLRKAAGRRLADAGATANQIMSVLGHKSLSEATRYTRDADQKRNAREAMAQLVRSDMTSANSVLSSKKVSD